MKTLDVENFDYSFELTSFVNRNLIEVVTIIYRGKNSEDKYYTLFYYKK